MVNSESLEDGAKDTIKSLILQVSIAANLLAKKARMTDKDVLKMLIETAREMAQDFTEEEMSKVLLSYSKAIDEISEADKKVDPANS